MNPETTSRRSKRIGRGLTAAAASLALGAGLSIHGGAPAHADDCLTRSVYTYTGGVQCLIVPAGVTAVTFDAYGAQGGSGGNRGGTGGLGAQAKATVAVQPGQRYFIYVGGMGAGASEASGHGSPSVPGGWNGGGQGGGSNGTVTTSGGGGGGATDIRTGSDLDSRVLVAAGGGGAGGWGGGWGGRGAVVGGNGGQGGGQGAGEGYGPGPDEGLNSRYNCKGVPGSGGAAGQGGGAGRNGYEDEYTCFGGGGGGLTSGGNYTFAAAQDAWNGTYGRGGDGGCLQFPDCSINAAVAGGGGGGGGGGVYGGAGDAMQGNALSTPAGSGGGGGSSTGPSGATFARGFNPGNGKVYVSFATTVTLTSSNNPNTYYDGATFTAKLTPASATGAVQFQTNGYDITGCGWVGVSGGSAQCSLAPDRYLSVGPHLVTARFHGRSGFADNAATVNQLAVAQTTTELAATAADGTTATSVASGQPVTLTSTVHAMGSPLTIPLGGVTFSDNGTPLQTVWPQQTGTADSRASIVVQLPLGSHSITASYLGTTLSAPSGSGRQTLTATSPLANGTFRLLSASSGKALEVAGASQANGASIDQRSYAWTTNQQWKLTRQSDGSYTVVAAHSNKALDVPGGSLDDDVQVIQWTTSASTNQRWWIVPAAGGSYQLLSVNSGKALDVRAGSTADGGAIIQYTSSGAANQQWQIARAGAVAKITVSPENATIRPGGSQTYQVTAFDQDGQNLGDVTGMARFTMYPDGSCSSGGCTAATSGYHAIDVNALGAYARVGLTVRS